PPKARRTQHMERGKTGYSVSPEEAGMKLLRFLERKLGRAVPVAALHKWIRSGQVRLNSGRTRAFTHLAEGDFVRVPPFALSDGKDCPDWPLEEAEQDGERPFYLHAETRDFLVLRKDPGLACQDGSGQRDSLAGMLARAYARNAYVPAPAHRLDRHTSGLVLAGRSHKAQQRLHALFRQGLIAKDYLAWVRGDWPHDDAFVLEDSLVQTHTKGRDAICALPEQARTRPFADLAPGSGAVCVLLPVQRLAAPEASLLLIRLVTGRKHQIRVQLSSRGFPVIGDGRYGGPRFFPMLLHAFSLRFAWEEPGDTGEAAQEYSFVLEPDWPETFRPDPGQLAAARGRFPPVCGRPAAG
ncbi:RluA family pseudouridine synthase, partial [Desulfovibrio sp. OttesenSCG-928-A18]|nr:RluA family pseudouridine synthase [Desulfovibrio sp. OttesenSCG-928-A18]